MIMVNEKLLALLQVVAPLSIILRNVLDVSSSAAKGEYKELFGQISRFLSRIR
jgi:hypothetical protein